jgi:hypothetical protein
VASERAMKNGINLAREIATEVHPIHIWQLQLSTQPGSPP